jgi:peptidoglycan/xylan/chitin deacetylase (PgdA/CDA1 family)
MEALKKAGFNTILFSELHDYVVNDKPLPNKPVIVTMDDGYYSNYQFAYPILKALGMKAEISVIGCWVGAKDTPGVIPHFSWNEALEMQTSDNVHIEAHSYRMHDYDPSGRVTRYGVLKRPDENYEQYIRAMSSDTRVITAMIKQNMGGAPLAYTYPNGLHNPLSEKIIQSFGYKVTLTTKVGINTIIKEYPSSLYHLMRIAVDDYNGDVVQLILRSYF